MIPLLKIGEQQTFAHHRCGWAYAIDCLRPLHKDTGVRLEGFLDNAIFWRAELNEPFVGFLHNPLTTPSGVRAKYESRGAYNNLNSDCWRDVEHMCKGIFVLSEDLRRKVSDMTDCPCECLIHPVEMCDKKFQMDIYEKDPKVVHLGQWMRRFDSFRRLSCPQRKVPLSFEEEHAAHSLEAEGRLENEEFDLLMSESVVFIHLFDVVACNAVLDCIARNTPIVCNRLPATEQYLGSDYPGLFESLKEAESILGDRRKIEMCHEFMRKSNKERFSGGHFLQSVYDSKIYRNLIKPSIKVI
jgi:hypothetical protein